MVGCNPSSPRNTVLKTAQSTSWYAASSHPAMGETFCSPINRLVSAKEFKVPPPKIASQFRLRSAASDPSEGQRSGKKMYQGVPHPFWVLGV